MPMFDFECEACEESVVDVLLSIAEASDSDRVQACPKCGKPMKKLLGGGHFKLNCAGFHNTDYGGGPLSR